MRTIIVLVALVRHIFCYLSSSSVTTGTSQWEDISPILVKRPLSDVNVKKNCISFCNFWCEDSDMLSFFTIGEQILNALWLPATLNECMENTRLAVVMTFTRICQPGMRACPDSKDLLRVVHLFADHKDLPTLYESVGDWRLDVYCCSCML